MRKQSENDTDNTPFPPSMEGVIHSDDITPPSIQKSSYAHRSYMLPNYIGTSLPHHSEVIPSSHPGVMRESSANDMALLLEHPKPGGRLMATIKAVQHSLFPLDTNLTKLIMTPV